MRERQKEIEIERERESTCRKDHDSYHACYSRCAAKVGPRKIVLSH